jgi:hypothetical protein
MPIKSYIFFKNTFGEKMKHEMIDAQYAYKKVATKNKFKKNAA